MAREFLMAMGNPAANGTPDGYIEIQVEWSIPNGSTIRRVDALYYQNLSSVNRVLRVESREKKTTFDVPLNANTQPWAVYNPPGTLPVDMDATSMTIL